MFVLFRAEVEAAMEAALSSLDYPHQDLGLEEPPGDVPALLASNVAFRLADEADRPPGAVAAEIDAALEVGDLELVGPVETSGPYVNFGASDRYLTKTLERSQDHAYGRLPDRDRSVVVEHTSANPTGPVHVGRARNPIIGDAVANLLDFAGYEVDRHYYVNDAGRQMAVFTWAFERFDESSLPAPSRQRAEYDLVRYYRRGNEYLENADEPALAAAEAEIQAILQGLEAGKQEAYERVDRVVRSVLDGMRTCLARLPAEFDAFVRETRFMRDGSVEAVVERLKQLEQAVYEEEAWQLDLTDDGIEKNLVFLRSDGTSLYTTRDLAYHEWKLHNYDRAVTVLGEDHGLQADQLRATLEHLGNDSGPLEHVVYSYVNLPDGKMSTRAGTGIDLDDLLDEAVARARQEVESRLETRQRDDDLDAEAIDRIANQVGIGAVRYDIVSKQPSKAITFSWEQALDFEAQSAPYVQYVHARCCGIIEEAEAAGYEPAVQPDTDVLTAPEATALVRTIGRLTGVVEGAAVRLEPHRVATYTRSFAEAFNAFYRACPVLSAEDQAVRRARLALVYGSRNTIANALSILGVAAPERM